MEAPVARGSDTERADPIARLIRKRDLLQAAARGMGGLEFTRRHTRLFDDALVDVWNEAVARSEAEPNPRARSRFRAASGELALVALGGYGRRELCPNSDIDLMVLHRRGSYERTKAISEAVFYPLWNAGFDVGHAARSLNDCVALGTSELESATALLDARLVAGDEELFDSMTAELARRLEKKRYALVAQSYEALTRRWYEYGEGAYVLEPHVKDGCGGLRDVHQLMWMTKLVDGGATLEDLVETGKLSAHNRDLITESFDWLLRARVAIHYLSGRKNDRLYVEYQEDVAAWTGCDSADEFMRDYHRRSALVKHVSSLFWSRTGRERARRLRGLAARRSSPPAPAPARANPDLSDPAAALSVFGAAAREGHLPVPETVEAAHESLVGSVRAMSWSRHTREDFLSILRAGELTVGTLETMNDIGLLPRLLPHWDGVRYMPSSGPYHHFTVDMHSFRAVAEVGKMARGREPYGGLLSELCRELCDPDVLLLAALLHDIGKGARSGDHPVAADHSQLGAQLAAEVCRTTGLADRADAVVFLVRDHLLLPVTAGRRDTGDPHLLESLADRIGATERLKMLYLLTVADAVSTGPAAWTGWKAALIRELFFNVLHVLERREGSTAPVATSPSESRARARIALASKHPAAVDAFLEALPDSYFTGSAAEAVDLHFDLASRLPSDEVHTVVRPTSTPGAVEFSVGAPDRPGLLARVAGVLSLHNRTILSAQTYSLASGAALQIFVTAGYFDHSPEETDWTSIAADLEKALFGKMAIEYRLARKLASYASTMAGARAPEVIVDNDASPTATVIEVHADDRIGLLHTIAKALYDLGLDIRIAKVSTSADRAVDAFYVVDMRGNKIVDEGHIKETELAIEHALGRK